MSLYLCFLNLDFYKFLYNFVNFEFVIFHSIHLGYLRQAMIKTFKVFFLKEIFWGLWNESNHPNNGHRHHTHQKYKVRVLILDKIKPKC